jgi:hypothetical protein
MRRQDGLDPKLETLEIGTRCNEPGFLFSRFGHHSRNPVEEVDGSVLGGHGRKAREPIATSQDILAQYGVTLRFPTHLPTFL